MKIRHNVFSNKGNKFYCLSPYLRSYQVGDKQILLYRMDTGRRILFKASDKKTVNEFLDILSKPVSAECIQEEIINWTNTDDPEKLLSTLLYGGILESCG